MIPRALKSIFICMICCLPAATLAQTKIDPYLDQGSNIRGFKVQTINRSADLTTGASRDKDIEVFVKSNNAPLTREGIAALNGKVHMVSGNILAATVPEASLKSLSSLKDVQFIEAAKPVGFKNNVAGAEINSQEVHEGYNLPSPLTGKNVVIGIIDTGIDYDHPDFMDADGKTRIISIWDQNASSGSGPTEIEDSFGTECTSQMIASGSCPIRDSDGHGTHVAGTAAGRDANFGGVAPDANIIAVSYDSSMNLNDGYVDTIFSTKICQAAYYVFAKASALGRPAVVNLSLGTHIGAHDGSSLFEQCLAGLVEGFAGRAIVAAAGNEYSSDNDYTGIHTGFEVNGFQATNFAIKQISNDRVYYVDFWGSIGSDIQVGLGIRRENPAGNLIEFSGLVDAGQRKDGEFLEGEITYTINAGETESALNGKPHIGMIIRLSRSFSQIQNYSFDLVVNGRGSFDAWLFPDKPAKSVMFTSASGRKSDNWTYVPGDRIKNIAIPATSSAIFAVAGYATRNRWNADPSCCQVNFALGQLLDFSSAGPSAEPDATGAKPDIAAPGAMIASTLSADSAPNPLLIMSDGKHSLQAGTSMAAPFVSGAIALMFEANPNFNYTDIKNILKTTAYKDDSVGDVPNDRWGWGKLDVLAAVTASMNGIPSGNFQSNPGAGTPMIESGANSSPGCRLVSSASNAFEYQILLAGFFAVSLALLFLRRKTQIS